MSEGDPLPQAWQWLVPPVVDDGQGGLLPRKRPGVRSKQGDLETLSNQRGILPDATLDGMGQVDFPHDLTLLAHPAATHKADLLGHEVAYLLRRSLRKTIGFSVGAKGLEVTAPQWVPMLEVDSALQTKAGWIVRKLKVAGLRQQLKQDARILWQDGGTLDYLGQSMTLRLCAEVNEVSKTRQLYRAVGADASQVLHIPLLSGAPEGQVRAVVHAWILREARTFFTARMSHFALLLGVRWNALKLSSASTRWGSASSDGVIRLNWRLMQYSPQIIDYVVVHELSHLRYMDHSPRFWAVVAEVLPDWKQLRKSLRDNPLPAWDSVADRDDMQHEE